MPRGSQNAPPFRSYNIGGHANSTFRILPTSNIATTMSHVKVLFGTAYFGSLPTETSQEMLDLLKKYKVNDLDTAYRYVSKGAPSYSTRGKELIVRPTGRE